MQEEIERLPPKKRARAHQLLGRIGPAPLPISVSKGDLTRDKEGKRPKAITVYTSETPEVQEMEERNKGPLLADDGYGYFLTYAGDGDRSVRARSVHHLAELLNECKGRKGSDQNCHLAFAQMFQESAIHPDFEPVDGLQNMSHGETMSGQIRQEGI